MKAFVESLGFGLVFFGFMGMTFSAYADDPGGGIPARLCWRAVSGTNAYCHKTSKCEDSSECTSVANCDENCGQ